MIKAAESSGFLNLQLMNFQYIPKEVISMKKLKRLRLDCNRNLDLRLGIPEEFKNLTLLSLKSCKLTYIPESIDNLLKIEKLDLQENLIDFFPISFSKLKTLIVLGKSCLSHFFVICHFDQSCLLSEKRILILYVF